MSKASKVGKTSSPKSRFRRVLPWLFLLIALVCLAVGVRHFWPHRGAPPPSKGGWPPEIEAKRQTESERGLVYAGLPRPAQKDPTLTILRNQGYVAGYSDFRQNPLWVGYSLEGSAKGPAGKRPSKFETDPRTQSRVRHEEFTSTGYDRGHLAPNAGIAARLGFEAQKETFLLTNIVPMEPDLNRRVWQKLERLESDVWAPRFGKVWILTGPVFDDDRQLLGEANDRDRSRSRVEIPDAFYKIVIDEDGRDVRVLPFLVPQNVRGTETPRQFLTSIDRIEQLTGLDFLWALNDPHEDAIEKMVPSNIW
ncbi:MAG TPA: DNA/RNA non-specific endonuclease [Candidatus Ozemobacteraceae bacterium]|nr:DNA/RNA non-specific endonuclease [Candidatus Ozemobacteraceae bacterium]HQG29728.1 DNA/RNA non-specific endonuclease [Candidatus Ozemobacteraceae bacterium]